VTVLLLRHDHRAPRCPTGLLCHLCWGGIVGKANYIANRCISISRTKPKKDSRARDVHRIAGWVMGRQRDQAGTSALGKRGNPRMKRWYWIGLTFGIVMMVVPSIILFVR
jgi:hypothetical protein